MHKKSSMIQAQRQQALDECLSVSAMNSDPAAGYRHYLYSSKTHPTRHHTTHTDTDELFLALSQALSRKRKGIWRFTDVLTLRGEIHKIRSVDNPVIALLTDFGEEDFFVASLKGVIAGINPSARLIDVTHRVPSFNTAAGGFVLYAAYGYFPLRTIFLVIVDPGVGSNRKILLVETARYFFIAPDNGVLSLALEKERLVQAREIRNPDYFLPELSSTFEGRDKMASAAAWLSMGVPVEKFGPEVASLYKEKSAQPEVRGNELTGSIMYIDKFGNAITNLTAGLLETKMPPSAGRTFAMKLERQVKVDPGLSDRFEVVFRKTYDSAEKNDLIILKGSLGSLELAVKEGSAADKLKVRAGDRITLILDDE